MKTIILRVGARVAGPPAGYPVSIHCEDAGDGWELKPLASEMIPENLDGLVSAESVNVSGLSRDMVLAARPRTRAGGDLPELGEHLFQLVFRGGVSTKWKDLRRQYSSENVQQGKHGRRVLLDIRPPALRRLPWELLKMPGTPIWLACEAGNTFARISPWPNHAAQPSDPDDLPPFDPETAAPDTAGALRVLVIVGSGPNDPKVKAEFEVRAIERALWGLSDDRESPYVQSRAESDACRCRFDLHVLEQPNKAQIARACHDHSPHVFHFIGHGFIGDDGTTKLGLWSERNVANPEGLYTIDDIHRDISFHSLELAVLNCCYATPEAWQGGVWSIAQEFLEKGARAVLGTLGPVPGEAAAHLAGAFYRELAASWPIDVALERARAKVEQSGTEPFDRALPYLHLAAYPDAVLSLPGRDRVDPVASEREFKNNAHFVNRHDHRAWLRRAVVGAGSRLAPDAAPPRRVVLLKGVSGIGKTQLLRFMMEKWALGGHILKYVPLSDYRSLDFVSLIRAIKDGPPRSFLSGPLKEPPGAFSALNQTLNALARDKVPRSSQPKEYDTVDHRLSLGKKIPEKALDLISDKFLDGLKAVAGDGRGLTVVLDQLTHRDGYGVIPTVFQNLVKPKLIEPINHGFAPGVTLVIAVKTGPDRNEFHELGLSNLNPLPESNSLEPLPGTEFMRYAGEYCRRLGYAPEFYEDVIITLVPFFASAGWTPAECFNWIQVLVERNVARKMMGLDPGAPGAG
jgi:hypothetical protein